MKARATLETSRLMLRRPQPSDAEAIFQRYAGDAEVTRMLGWPVHKSVADTKAFLEISDAQWEQWPAGPYLIFSRRDGVLLGSTGLDFETPHRAATGYVLAKDSWGLGYATESLQEIVKVAADIGVQRLYALCHPQHRASWRVLEKCGFQREGTLQRYFEFPNFRPGALEDTLYYSRILGSEL